MDFTKLPESFHFTPPLANVSSPLFRPLRAEAEVRAAIERNKLIAEGVRAGRVVMFAKPPKLRIVK
jgi:hypothetical protein